MRGHGLRAGECRGFAALPGGAQAVIEGSRSDIQVREDTPAPEPSARRPAPAAGDAPRLPSGWSAKGVCHEFVAEAV
jgi:hypothetical protein